MKNYITVRRRCRSPPSPFWFIIKTKMEERSMKNYIYDTATGPVSIELDDDWVTQLEKADAEEVSDNRRHRRSDHKYAPGEPVSLDSLDYDGEWLTDRDDSIEATKISLDLERALALLTELQRRYFIMNHLEGYSCAEIARREGKHKVTVLDIVEAAEKKIQKYFG